MLTSTKYRLFGRAALSLVLMAFALPAGAADDATTSGDAAATYDPEAPRLIVTSVISNTFRNLRLRWWVPRWEDAQQGFRVLRREIPDAEPVGEWEQVGPDVIRPNLSGEVLPAYKLEWLGEKAPLPAGAGPRTAELLKAYAGKNGLGVRPFAAAAGLGPDFARALGMGWIDKDTKRDRTYQYALFAVVEGESAADAEPLTTTTATARRGVEDCPYLVECSAQRQKEPDTVKVVWAVHRRDIEAHNVDRWAIFRTTHPSPVSPYAEMAAEEGKRKGDLLYFIYTDTDAADDAFVRYAVAPMRRNSDEPGRLSRRVTARRRPQPPKAPTNVQFELKDSRVRITWEYDRSWEARPEGFHVYRRSPGESEWTQITDDPLPFARRFYDDSKVFESHPAQEVTYAVEALGYWHEENKFVASDQSMRIPAPVPPTPEGFAAEGASTEGEAFVRCRWDDVDSPGLGGYALEVLAPAEGGWKVVREDLTEASAVIPFEDLDSPVERTYRVRAVNVDGKKSDPSASAHVSLRPSGELEPFDKQVSVVHQAGKTTFLWEGPDNYEILTGFRLIVDGEQIADEETLGKYVRRWSTWEVSEGEHAVSMILVDQYGRVSEPSRPQAVAVRARAATDKPAQADRGADESDRGEGR